MMASSPLAETLTSLTKQIISSNLTPMPLSETKMNSDISPIHRMAASPSQSTLVLKPGTRVLILATENVVQRCPIYVNTIGIVKEAPVHPATWFKVQFHDDKVLTFRPSALQPVDDNDKPLADYVVKSTVPRHSRVPKDNSDNNSVEKAPRRVVVSRPVDGTPEKEIKSLQETDHEKWVGQRVIITAGKQKGAVGIVRSTGNGWIQIDTNMGEVAKRVYELAIYNENETKNYTNSSSDFQRSHPTMKHSFDGPVVKKSRSSLGRPHLAYYQSQINRSLFPLINNDSLDQDAEQILSASALLLDLHDMKYIQRDPETFYYSLYDSDLTSTLSAPASPKVAPLTEENLHKDQYFSERKRRGSWDINTDNEEQSPFVAPLRTPTYFLPPLTL